MSHVIKSIDITVKEPFTLKPPANPIMISAGDYRAKQTNPANPADYELYEVGADGNEGNLVARVGITVTGGVAEIS